MSSVRRVVFVALGALSLACGLPLVAQEPESRTEEPASKPTVRKYDPSRRVPDYFGQIGLTTEQRESIYKVRSGHLAKIDELEKQISELRQQMQRECEGILTDTQKQLLEERRKAAAVNRANAAALRRAAANQAASPK